VAGPEAIGPTFPEGGRQDVTLTEEAPARAIFTMSPSRLSTYLSCGRKYQIREALRDAGLPMLRSGPMLVGSAVHQTIAWCEQTFIVLGGDRRYAWEFPLETRVDESADQVGAIAQVFLAELNRLVEAEGGADQIQWGGRKSKQWPGGEDFTWAKHVGPMMLRAYCESRLKLAERGLQVLEGHVEVYVSMLVDPDFLVRGYVDLLMVMVDENGEGIVVDWKTGKMAEVVQLASYARMVRATFEIPVSRGIFVKLRPGAKERLVEHDLRPMLSVIDELYRAARAGVEAGMFPMVPSAFCPSCDVRRLCPWGSVLPEKELPDE
jgi:CRISPR/Cas system-associated exonuclease Cas4 (RecB family)